MSIKLLTILNAILKVVPHKTITGGIVLAITLALQKYFPGVTEDQVFSLLQQVAEWGFGVGLFNWRLDEFLKANSWKY